jgi:hypothetical protein
MKLNELSVMRIYCGLQNLQKSCYSPNFADPAVTRGVLVSPPCGVREARHYVDIVSTRPPRLDRLCAARDLPFPLHPLDNGPSELWSHVTEIQTSVRARAIHTPILYLNVCAIPQPTPAYPSVHATDQRLDRPSVHMGPALEP